MHGTAYLGSAWLKAPLRDTLDVVRNQYQTWFLGINTPFHLELVTYVGLLALVLIVVMSLCSGNGWFRLVDVCVLYLLALAPLLLTGGAAGPIRALSPAVPLILMAYVLIVLSAIKPGWLRSALLVCTSFLVFFQAKATSDLQQTDILIYQSEVAFTNQMMNAIQAKGIQNYSNYEIAVVGEKRFNTALTQTGNVIGFSHYNWDMPTQIGSNGRIQGFLQSQGFTFRRVTPRNYQRALQLAGEMKTFPAKRGILVRGHLIVVKLQSN